MVNIAVVILNYNGEALLRQFLPSVITHSQEATIYVADNGSEDQSIPLLETSFPSVRIIRLTTNYGFCRGYNEALKQVITDWYVLLNSDVEVTAGWLVPILALAARADIAAIQPKILSYRNKSLFEHAGAGGGLMDRLGYPYCRGRLVDYVEEDHGQYNDEREIFWASGACLAIRADVFHAWKGFDEYFFAHMEEIDLCWKIQRSAYRVYYTGHSTVYHLGAGTLGYDSPRKVYLNFRNNLLMLFKHFTTAELLTILPLRWMLDWVAAANFLLQRKHSSAVAVLKAHGAFLRALIKEGYFRKRRELHKRYTHNSHATQVPRSPFMMLLTYYRQRKKT